MSSSSILRNVYIIFCIAGATYHFVSVSQEYFSYSVNIKIDIQDTELVELPALTICSDMPDILNVDKIMNQFPHWKSLTNKNIDLSTRNKKERAHITRSRRLKKLLNSSISDIGFKWSMDEINKFSQNEQDIFRTCGVIKQHAERANDY